MERESIAVQRIGAVLFYGIVVLLAYLVFRISEPFLAPLAWAGVLVVIFYPLHRRLERRWGKTWAASASTTGVTLILIVPAIFVGIAFVRQSIEAVRNAQQAFNIDHVAWVGQAWQRLSQHIPGTSPEDLSSLAKQNGEKLGAFLASQLGPILKNLVGFFFDLFVIILAMFYFFRDADDIMAGLRQILPFEEEHSELMIRDSHELIFASVTSSLVAAAFHAAAGGIGFAVTGVGAPVFWGVLMGFFSLVPVIGSAFIWLPAAIGLMLKGHIVAGIFLIVLCSVVVGLVDNLIRPWMISGRAQLSGLVIFVGVLGGIAVFGLLGVVLGPIVVALAASLLELYRKRGRPKNAATPSGKPVGGNHEAVLE
jgi:predicted PurR-regulated permease PerM